MGKLDKILGSIGLKLLKGFVLERNLDPAKINHDSIKNILVVLRHQMGDMLCATPMMRTLKSFYPESKLQLVTKKSTRYEEIFTGENSLADEVYSYENGVENFLNLVKELKEKKIDLAVIPSTVVFSSTNHLIAHYSKAKICVGVKSMDFDENKVSYLLNVKNDFMWSLKKVHQTERNQEIINQLNIPAKETKIRITLNKEFKDFAEEFYKSTSIDRSKPVVSFHPGAAKEGNVWPAEKFAELACRLNNKFGAQILISEGPDDKKYVESMLKILKETCSVEKVTVHKGLLMRNLAIINLSNLFISNDTGVMHLASGLDIPVIGLFGPSKAYEWGPIGENKVSIQAGGSDIHSINTESVFQQCSLFLAD